MHFRDGFKFDDAGNRVAPVHRKQFTGSDAYSVYTATAWADGTSSCNCRGWSIHKRCKHAKQVGFEAQYGAASLTTPAATAVAEAVQTQASHRRLK